MRILVKVVEEPMLYGATTFILTWVCGNGEEEQRITCHTHGQRAQAIRYIETFRAIAMGAAPEDAAKKLLG